MKKLILACFFLATGFALNAQNLRLGVQASPNITWMASANNTINSSGTRLGFKIGPIGEYYFQENYAIISGINLAFNQGGTLTHQTGGNLWPNAAQNGTTGLDSIPNGSSLTYKLQKLEIPFGAKFRTNQVGYFRYFVEIPFIFGIKTSARGDVSGAGFETSKENITSDTNILDVSWGIGAGVEYEISENTSIIGGMVFQGGIPDLTKDNGVLFGGDAENSKTIMNALNFKIGVMF